MTPATSTGPTTPSAATKVRWQPKRARHADALLDARRLGPAALRVLANLANGRPTYRGIEAKAARRALDALALAGIVTRGSERGDWSVTDPLFVDYLRRTLPRT